jgi:hypothetical protein
MGWALLPAAIEPASGNTTHKLPRPTASILSRRLHTLNSSCRIPRCNRSGPGVVGVWSSKLSQSWWSLKASLVGCRRLEPGATNCQGRWFASRDTAFGPTSPQATSQSPGLDPPFPLHPTLPFIAINHGEIFKAKWRAAQPTFTIFIVMEGTVAALSEWNGPRSSAHDFLWRAPLSACLSARASLRVPLADIIPTASVLA